MTLQSCSLVSASQQRTLLQSDETLPLRGLLAGALKHFDVAKKAAEAATGKV